MAEIMKKGALKAVGWTMEKFKGLFKWWALGLAALVALYGYIKFKL